MPPNLGLATRHRGAVRSGELDEGILDGRCPECSTWSAGRVGARAAAPMTWPHHQLAQEARLQVPYCSATTGHPAALPRGHGGSGGRLARTPRFQGQVALMSAPRGRRARGGAPAAGSPGTEVTFAPAMARANQRRPALAADAARLAAGAAVVVAFLGLPAPRSPRLRPAPYRPASQPTGHAGGSGQGKRGGSGGAGQRRSGAPVQLGPPRSGRAGDWLSGQAWAGRGRAALGHASPSGHLTETIPLRLEDCPSHLNFPARRSCPLRRGVFVGYRGYDASHRR